MPFRFLITIFFLLAASCAPQVKQVVPVLNPGAGLRIYLEPLPQETFRLTFNLAKISALRLDGSEFVVREQPALLGGEDRSTLQKRLAATNLPPGIYQGVKLYIDSAMLRTEEGESALLVPETPLVVENAFTIKSDRTLTLFLGLSPDRIIKEGFQFTPRFSLWKPQPALPGLKGFTTNSIAGTLTVFEKKTPKVTSTVALGHTPSELVLDQARGWIYVALAGENSIAAVDIVNEIVKGRISLRPGDEPREIALTADGRTLVTANSGSHSLSIVNTLSLYEQDRVLLSSEPTSVFFSATGDRAFVVSESTSTLTVVDTRASVILSTTQLPESPIRGATSADGQRLYLLTAYSPDLLVLDALSLAIVSRKYVGHGALSIVIDENVGLIYVGLASGDVVILDASLDLPIDSFSTSGPVSYLTIDREENSLFALIEGKMRVEKYDLVSRKLLGAIAIDEGGYAVSVMGEE